MFTRAKQNRAFEDVIVQIQQAIVQGGLKVGDKLPSERTLRNVFEVSRGTLREALRTLEQKGLITIKVGGRGGAFVCSADTRQMSESLDLLLQLQKVNLNELIEFRETVEGAVAAKAARIAKRKDLDDLALILESIKAGLDAPELEWNRIVKADHNFHLTLVRITGNQVFESVLLTIYDNINRYLDRVLPKERWVLERNYRDLCRIATAVRKRDSKRAKQLAEKHVKLFAPMVEE